MSLQIPVSLHKLVSDKLASIIRGKDPDVVTGKCTITDYTFLGICGSVTPSPNNRVGCINLLGWKDVSPSLYLWRNCLMTVSGALVPTFVKVINNSRQDICQ